MKYDITGWCGVPKKFLSEERFKEVKEAGLTYIGADYDPETMKKALEIAEKVGIGIVVEDARIYEILKEPEKLDELAKAITDDYKDYKALKFYHVVDEPNECMFELLGKITRKFEELDPLHPVYINLFPNYASNEQLGSSSYDSHVKKYLEIVKPYFLSYDHYHLMQEAASQENVDLSSDKREQSIYNDAFKSVERAGFYDNLEIVRKRSLEYNTPYMLIILLVAHGPYRYLTKEEISYEVYQTLAYGCTSMSYFTYWNPSPDTFWHFREAVISYEGEKNQHFYDIKSINEKLLPLGREIEERKSTAVFHVFGDFGDKDVSVCISGKNENVMPFKAYNGIENVEGGFLTVGFFEDDRMIIANKDFKKPANVKITSDFDLERFDYKTGKYEKTAKDLTILPGDGELFRIIK